MLIPLTFHAPVLKPTNEKLCSRPAPSQNLNGKVGSGPAGPLLTRGTLNGGKESAPEAALGSRSQQPARGWVAPIVAQPHPPPSSRHRPRPQAFP